MDLKGDRKGFIQILLTIVIVIMIGAIGFSIYLLLKQSESIKNLSQKVDAIERKLPIIEKDTGSVKEEIKKAKEKMYVNLTVPAVQRIDSDFMVAKLSVSPHMTGVKISGRIINATPLPQENLKFRITVSEKSTEFNINKLKPAGSKPFEVYIADLPSDKATTARFERLESAILYYSD